MKAKTVAQVIAAEAGGKTRAQRYSSMLDIASAAYNRAKATGTTLKDVVGITSQFNAYNNKMPPGTASLTSLAEQALSYVEQNGPVHAGTYYATPATVGNLPKGLVQVPGVSAIHTVFEDPQNRAIVTASGVKRVKEPSRLPDVAPTPTARPEAALPAGTPTAARFGHLSLPEQVAQIARATSPMSRFDVSMAPSAQASPWTGALSVVDRALAERMTPASAPAATAGPVRGLSEQGIRQQAQKTSPQLNMAPSGVATAESGTQSAVDRAVAERMASEYGKFAKEKPTTTKKSWETDFASMLGLTAFAGEAPAQSAPSLSQPAGTPTEGYDTKAKAAGTPTEGYAPKAQPAGTPTAGYDPKAKAAGTPTAGYEPAAPSLKERNKQLKAEAARYAGFEAERARSMGALPAPNAGVTAPSLSRRGTAPANYATPAAALRQPAGTPFSSVGASLKASPSVASPPNPGSLRGRPAGALPSTLGGATMSNPNFSAPSVAPRPTPAPRPSAATLAANLANYQRGTVPGSSLPATAPTPTTRPSMPAAPARPAPSIAAPAPARFGAPAPAAVSTTTFAPGTAPSNPSQLGGLTMSNPKGLIDLSQETATAPFGVESVLAQKIGLPAPLPEMPAFTQQTIGQAMKERAPAYTPPRATAYDVYSGKATVGMDNTGQNTITRNPDGTTSVTNKYGATTVTMPDGKQAAGGGLTGMPGLTGIKSGIKGAYNKVAPQTGLGKVAAAVTAAGLGGLPGIAAGIAAGKIGDKISGKIGGLPSVASGIKSSASSSRSSSSSGSKSSTSSRSSSSMGQSGIGAGHSKSSRF